MGEVVGRFGGGGAGVQMLYSLRYLRPEKSTPGDDRPNCDAIKAIRHLHGTMAVGRFY